MARDVTHIKVVSKGERQIQILKMIQERQSVQVAQLARHFQVSEMTIRRDLHYLAEEYNIAREYGGACIEKDAVVRNVDQKDSTTRNIDKKRRIAKEATDLIEAGQVIFIDSGSTTRQMMQYIPDNLRAIVITNNLRIAEYALNSANSLETVILGGALLRSISGTYGQETEQQIRNYHIDVAFLGAVSIGSDGLIYDGYTPEARLKSIIFSLAEKIYILADSTKFNMQDLHSFGRLSQIDAIITDDGLGDKAKKLLDRYENLKTIIV